MAPFDIDADRSAVGHSVPRIVAILGGAGFVAVGVWALVHPQSFFEALARFEPYNQHFLQDIGAFQVGLGVVLMLAGLSVRADGLTVALVGVGVAAALHAVSHIVGRDLGEAPEREIPGFAAMAVALLAAGGLRWRQVRGAARDSLRLLTRPRQRRIHRPSIYRLSQALEAGWNARSRSSASLPNPPCSS